MAEFGLVASIFQVAGTGLKLSRALYEYADAVANADRRIRDIAKEIKLTSSILDELGTLFEQNDTSTLLSKNALHTADETLGECSTLFAEIETALAKSTKNAFGRFKFPFREPKIEVLRSQIDKLKSTLQLLMQVLTYAHQVASRRLDREAETAQIAEIKVLLLNKKKSTKIYMESLRQLRLGGSSDGDSSWEEDGNREMETTRIDSSMAIKVASVGSTITVKTLESCVDHIRGLLDDIEGLQKTLSDQGDGLEHAKRHQNVIGSYFRTRNHLDSVLLGSSEAPSDYNSTTSARESFATGGTTQPPITKLKGGLEPPVIVSKAHALEDPDYRAWVESQERKKRMKSEAMMKAERDPDPLIEEKRKAEEIKAKMALLRKFELAQDLKEGERNSFERPNKGEDGGRARYESVEGMKPLLAKGQKERLRTVPKKEYMTIRKQEVEPKEMDLKMKKERGVRTEEKEEKAKRLYRRTTDRSDRLKSLEKPSMGYWNQKGKEKKYELMIVEEKRDRPSKPVFETVDDQEVAELLREWTNFLR